MLKTIYGNTLGCAYSIVGYQGRTLATPIVKVPAGAATVQLAPIVGTIAHTVPVVGLGPLTTPRITPTIPVGGGSKADVARALMVQGHREGKSVQQIIAAIMQANGHSKALATSYYKNNTEKLGLPAY